MKPCLTKLPFHRRHYRNLICGNKQNDMIMWMPSWIITLVAWTIIYRLFRTTNITNKTHPLRTFHCCCRRVEKMIPCLWQNSKKTTKRVPPVKNRDCHHKRNKPYRITPTNTTLNTNAVQKQLTHRIDRVKTNTARTTKVIKPSFLGHVVRVITTIQITRRWTVLWKCHSMLLRQNMTR